MDTLFQVIIILTAGISQTLGSSSFSILYFKEDGEIDPVSGILYLLHSIFVLLPLLGYILIAKVLYSIGIHSKHIFHFRFYTLFIGLFHYNRSVERIIVRQG